ncbi:MAG: GtrA family protein [Erysipelotrichaceae bacterium]|nr:GtrA family protein [Erysipelotrichaceae bacterium]
MKEVLRFLKFTFFSVSAGLIEILTFTLLNEIVHAPYWLSYLCGLVLSVVWNFTLNRKFTFQSAGNIPEAMMKVALFYLIFTPASTWLEHFMTGTLGFNEYLATAINMILNFVSEFFYQRYYVFGSTIDTGAKKD